MLLDVFQTRNIFEENINRRNRAKNKETHKKKNHPIYFLRQIFIKRTQTMMTLVIGCRNRSTRSMVFPTDQGRLYNTPNVDMDSHVYLEQDILEKCDTFAKDDDWQIGNEKDLSATGELLDFLNSDPMIRIRYWPDRVVRFL